MISISGLSVHFGGTYLFDSISYTIRPGERIGLVGKNGAGKSTMLKIIAGVQEPEKGRVSYPAGGTVGYLPQEGIIHEGKTVFDEAASVFDELHRLDERIDELSHMIAERTDHDSDEYMALIEELTENSERRYSADLGGFQGEVEKILLGLGFLRSDLERPTREFSGGWQMRIALAKILLRRPSVVLLDEPTNHLDIESVQWLEQFLKGYQGSVVLVSHDREFLDVVTNRTIEITLGKIEDYPMSYSKYVVARQERRDLQMAAYQNQQREIEKTKDFIERFRYKATKANQVQSRIKALDKLDIIEVEDEDTSAIHFDFPPAPRSGRLVAELQSATKRYDQKVVLNRIDFAVERGDKIAFVGRNGEGKSTLAKIIAGIESVEGVRSQVHNVSIGYYAQHQAEMLDHEATVLDIIDRAATGEIRTKIRDILGAFLFSGDSVYKKVKVLSGGEKSRLALAKLLLEPYNFLILDEPTNHLDMRSKDVLKRALQRFEGAIVVVSHDRDFLRGLTNKVMHFRGGAIKEYIGDIYEYLESQRLDSLAELERPQAVPVPAAKPVVAAPVVAVPAVAAKPVISQQERKDLQKEERRLRKAADDLEKRIAELEREVNAAELAIAAPEVYTKPEYPDMVRVLDAKKAELDTCVNRWSEALEELEDIVAKL